ncbi:hypothetical protein C2G38_2070387 [Gigaspora rosea]|uniref:Uncharacterized protein n=1 Tax=Gigaspora rosea TaxID=44941 RepID=A0A397VTB6_9GLOM|nr:hypothetical protein C2G38_2070387 [Gigaspora rosea]
MFKRKNAINYILNFFLIFYSIHYSDYPFKSTRKPSFISILYFVSLILQPVAIDFSKWFLISRRGY